MSQQEIIGLLNNKWMTINDVCVVTNISRRTINRSIKKLHKDGFLEKSYIKLKKNNIVYNVSIYKYIGENNAATTTT